MNRSGVYAASSSFFASTDSDEAVYRLSEEPSCLLKEETSAMREMVS